MRPIDSDAAYQFLTDQLVKETGAFSRGVNKGLNIARSALRNEQIAPTLTPQNEALTCEGCIHEHNEHENCNYCKRASYLGDYYYRRPPEGEV